MFKKRRWFILLLVALFSIQIFAACDSSSDPVIIQGADGEDGKDGKDGQDGVDGQTPYIKDGYWWIGDTNTNVKAEGIDGVDGTDGKDGTNGTNGKDGEDGKDGVPGKNGADGQTPYIKDGYWWIGNTNTNVKAEGVDGENGQNGTPGKDGQDGAPGKDGVDGQTPYIKDGYWWIGDTNTNVKAEGIDGVDGTDGKDGTNGTNGKDGVSVVDAYVDENLHLWLVLSNGTKIDAGYVGVNVTPTPDTYTVTFVDYDGTELKVETVESGKNATAPADPTRDGFTFIGWDKTFDNITGNLTVTAQYQEIISPTVMVHNVTANVGDETVSVVISLLNNPGISSMKLSVSYGNELTLQNVVFDSAYGAYVTAPAPYSNPQSITFISPLVEVNASGTFATLTFKLSETITTATTIDISITVDQENTYDEDFVDVAFATVNGKVTVN